MSNNKTPRSRHGRKDWSPRKIEEKSLSDSKGSSSRWDTTSSLSTPCTGGVRPSSWDNSDDEEEIITLEVTQQYFPAETRVFSNYCGNFENEVKETKSKYSNFPENEKTVYTALLEEVKIIDLDRRQSPARVRRRSKSSGSSSPVHEGKSENFSEKEGNLSSEDSDIVSPKLNYLDFNNILLDLQSKQVDSEENKSIDHKKLNLEPLIHDVGNRYCRTSRKLSKILEVEEMKKENEEKPQSPKTESKNKLSVTINSVLLHHDPLQDKLEVSVLPPNNETVTENISQKLISPDPDLNRISLNKCLSVEKLIPNNNLLDFKRGSLSDRCQFLKSNDNDNVIFLTAKTGKTEIGFTKESSWMDWSNQISSATVFPATETKANELEMFKESEGIKNILRINVEKNSQNLNQYPQLVPKNSNNSINLSERTLTEDILYLESPKFQINIDSARSIDVEDLRTPSSDKYNEVQKIIKSNKSKCENSLLTDTFRKNKNFDVKKEYSKRLKYMSKSCREGEEINCLLGNKTNTNQEKKKIEEPSCSENSSTASTTEVHNKSKENLFTWEKLNEMAKFQERQDEFDTSRTFHVGQETGSEERESELEWDKVENFNFSTSSRTQASVISENTQLFQNNGCVTNRSSNTTPKSKNNSKISKDSFVLSSNNSSPKTVNAVQEKKMTCTSSRGLSKSSKWKELIEMQNVSKSRNNSREYEVGKAEQKTVSAKTENCLDDTNSFTQTNYSNDNSKYNSLSPKRGNNVKRIHKRNSSKNNQIIDQKESTQILRGKTEKHTEKIHSDTVNANKRSLEVKKEIHDQVSVDEKPTNLIKDPAKSPQKHGAKRYQCHKTQDILFQIPRSSSEEQKVLNSNTKKNNSLEIYQKHRPLDPDFHFESLSIYDKIDYNSEKSSGRVTFDDIIKNFEFKSSEALTEEDEDGCRIKSEKWNEKNKESEIIDQENTEISSKEQNERKPENTSARVQSVSLNEKPIHDTGTWNDLIETFNKNQKYLVANNFPGFPGGSQIYEGQLQEVVEDQSGSEETTPGTETQKSSQLQKVKDNDFFPYFNSGLKNCLNEKDFKKKKNFLECRSQTFFFDLEKREPFGIGECGDATFWNFDNLKQTDSEKPKDHGDGYQTFEKWEETNLPSKKSKETKNQRQLWTELREESLNKSPTGSIFFTQESNIQLDRECKVKTVKKSLSDEFSDKTNTQENQIQNLGKSNFENIGALVKQRNGKNKYETKSNSEVCIVNSDPEDERKPSNLETVRRLSCSAFTINTTDLQNENENMTNLSNNSNVLNSKNVFKSTENLKRFEMFLLKKGKNKKYEKQNNWLTVHHSGKKKKFKKINEPKQEKEFSLKTSTMESGIKTAQTPTAFPIPRLRKTSCLRSFCKRVVSVFCLTSDSSTATSKNLDSAFKY